MKFKLKQLWNVYFGIISILLITNFIPEDSFDLIGFSINVFFAIALLPLFGFIKKIAIGSPVLWIVYFVIGLVLQVLLLSLLLYSQQISVINSALYFLVDGIVIGPTYFAIFKYARQSPEIWERNI